MSNVTPDFYRSTLKRDNIWRTQGLLGHEYDRGIMIAPENAAGTPFGVIQPGTPMGKIVGGDYDGLWRPAGAVQVDGDQEDVATVLTKASDLLFAGDRVLLRTFSRGSVISGEGPFRLAHGQNLVIEVDGDEQDVSLSAPYAYVESVGFDHNLGGVSAPQAFVKSANAQPFALADGMVLSVKVDDEAVAQDLTVAATQASLTGVGGTFAAQAGDLVVEINGVAFTITFGAEDELEQFLATINAGITGGMALAATGQIKIQSDVFGNNSQVKILGEAGGSAALVLANLGLSAAEDQVFGELFDDVSKATAVEVREFINDAIVGGLSERTETDGRVFILTDTLGEDGSIQVTGGTANAVLGFDTDLHEGAEEVTLALEIDGVEQSIEFETIVLVSVYRFAAKLAEGIVGGRALIGYGGEIRFQSDTKGTNSQVKILATGSSADLLAAIGIAGDTEDVVATADAADISRMTAEELATWISADFTGVSADVMDDGTVRVSTDELGEDGSIQVTGGTANAVLGFDTDLHEGEGIGGLPYNETWMPGIQATVLSVNKAAKTVTFTNPVTVIDGAVIRLDNTQAGYGVEGGASLGINNKAVTTYDERRTNDLGVETHTRRQSNIGCAGTGYAARIVGWCDPVQDDLQNRGPYATGCMVQFRDGDQY